MNTVKKMTKAVLASGLVILGLGMFRAAKASGSPTDTMTITVTPGGVTYAVAISSPYAGGYNFGQVNIGLTTISTLPIAVQNLGNVNEYFSLGVQDITPLVGWINAVTPANVVYTIQGMFVATGSGQPANVSFVGAANNVPGIVSGIAQNKFNQGSTKTLPLASQDLYLQLLMPLGVVDTGQHTMMLSITGQGA